MPTSTYITLVVIYTVQGIIIIVGNAFTIFVFWTQRSRLTRTYFLLVNLAVADFLVGITELIVIGTVKFQDTGEGYAGSVLRQSRSNPSAAFVMLFSSSSVYFLALVSLERAFAVLSCFPELLSDGWNGQEYHQHGSQSVRLRLF